MEVLWTQDTEPEVGGQLREERLHQVLGAAEQPRVEGQHRSASRFEAMPDKVDKRYLAGAPGP